jgi:hypothetical protein
MDSILLEEAIAALALDDIFLFNSSIRREKEFETKNCPTKNVTQENQIQVKADIVEFEDNEEISILRAIVSFEAKFLHNRETEKEVELCSIEASFVAIYNKTDDVSDEALQEFITYNTVHNVWPFWREHAFRITREARLPTPKIPFFHNSKK